MPAPTMAPIPRKAAPRTLMSWGRRRWYRPSRRMPAEEQVVALARDVHVPVEHRGRRGLRVQARRNANHKVPPGVLLKLETALLGTRRARCCRRRRRGEPLCGLAADLPIRTALLARRRHPRYRRGSRKPTSPHRRFWGARRAAGPVRPLYSSHLPSALTRLPRSLGFRQTSWPDAERRGVELPHGRPHGEDPRVARAGQEVLATDWEVEARSAPFPAESLIE
jgi:hypothetical protein